jgi:hypothetical protein
MVAQRFRRHIKPFVEQKLHDVCVPEFACPAEPVSHLHAGRVGLQGPVGVEELFDEIEPPDPGSRLQIELGPPPSEMCGRLSASIGKASVDDRYVPPCAGRKINASPTIDQQVNQRVLDACSQRMDARRGQP